MHKIIALSQSDCFESATHLVTKTVTRSVPKLYVKSLPVFLTIIGDEDLSENTENSTFLTNSYILVSHKIYDTGSENLSPQLFRRTPFLAFTEQELRKNSTNVEKCIDIHFLQL